MIYRLSCAALAEQFPYVLVDPSVLCIFIYGDILTSACSAASIDLCLHVVRHRTLAVR